MLRNIPLLVCTDHFMIGGEGMSYLLPSLMCLPKVPCPQLHFDPQMSQPNPSRLLTNAPRPGGFPYCPAPAWGLGPSPHTTLHRLWTSSERGSREQGKGGAGAGRVLMQSWGGSEQGGCPRGGWSAAASAPACEAGRAQSKLDLVPCSGYRALSAGRLHLSN